MGSRAKGQKVTFAIPRFLFFHIRIGFGQIQFLDPGMAVTIFLSFTRLNLALAKNR
jgi:hypothetical protein